VAISEHRYLPCVKPIAAPWTQAATRCQQVATNGSVLSTGDERTADNHVVSLSNGAIPLALSNGDVWTTENDMDSLSHQTDRSDFITDPEDRV
jgi:hypothetical protein